MGRRDWSPELWHGLYTYIHTTVFKQNPFAALLPNTAGSKWSRGWVHGSRRERRRYSRRKVCDTWQAPSLTRRTSCHRIARCRGLSTSRNLWHPPGPSYRVLACSRSVPLGCTTAMVPMRPTPSRAHCYHALKVLDHPPYSPDLSPDTSCVGSLKNARKGHQIWVGRNVKAGMVHKFQ
jgi:hypothetical protein